MAARLLASNFHLPSSRVFARTMSSKVNLSTMKPLKLYTLGTPNGLKTSGTFATFTSLDACKAYRRR